MSLLKYAVLQVVDLPNGHEKPYIENSQNQANPSCALRRVQVKESQRKHVVSKSLYARVIL